MGNLLFHRKNQIPNLTDVATLNNIIVDGASGLYASVRNTYINGLLNIEYTMDGGVTWTALPFSVNIPLDVKTLNMIYVENQEEWDSLHQLTYGPLVITEPSIVDIMGHNDGIVTDILVMPATSLALVYTFADSSTIDFALTQSANQINVTAFVKDGSIDETKLSISVLEKLQSTIPQKFLIVGDATTTDYIFNHAYQTKDFVYNIYNITTGEDVEFTVTRVDDNTIKVSTVVPLEVNNNYTMVVFFTPIKNVKPIIVSTFSVDFVIDTPATVITNAVTLSSILVGTEFTIDWGDGNTETVLTDNTLSHNAAHTYQNVGTYTVNITEQHGEVTSCRFNSQSTKVLSKFNVYESTSVNTLASVAQGQTKTIQFAPGFKFKTPNVITANSTFASSGVEYVPTDLLHDCVNITNIISFFGSSKIKEIQEGLVTPLMEVTTCGAFAKACLQLTTVGANLWKDHIKLISAGQCFYGCPLLTTIGDSMYEGCIALTDVNAHFSGNTVLQDIPVNTLRGCASITTLANFATNCKALVTIHPTLFRECTEVTTISNLLKANTGITYLSGDMLLGMSKVKDATAAFNGLANCLDIGDGLLNPIAPSVETTNIMFYNGTTKFTNNINNIMSVPFPKLLVTTNMFNGCNKMVGSGNAVIALLTAPPTTYTTMFRSCLLLSDYATIPAAYK